MSQNPFVSEVFISLAVAGLLVFTVEKALGETQERPSLMSPFCHEADWAPLI